MKTYDQKLKKNCIGKKVILQKDNKGKIRVKEMKQKFTNKLANNAITEAKIGTLTKKQSRQVQKDIEFCNKVILPTIRKEKQQEKERSQQNMYLLSVLFILMCISMLLTTYVYDNNILTQIFSAFIGIGIGMLIVLTWMVE